MTVCVEVAVPPHITAQPSHPPPPYKKKSSQIYHDLKDGHRALISLRIPRKIDMSEYWITTHRFTYPDSQLLSENSALKIFHEEDPRLGFFKFIKGEKNL